MNKIKSIIMQMEAPIAHVVGKRNINKHKYANRDDKIIMMQFA